MNAYLPPWGTAIVGLLTALIGGVIGAFVKSRPALRKIDADREANLLSERAKDMERMGKRIDGLERALADKDKAHAAEIEKIEEKQRLKDKYHEALRRASIHRMNNMSQQMQSLLMLLKKGVAVEDAVKEVEEMRARHLALETQETATIRAAAIKAGIAEDEE